MFVEAEIESAALTPAASLACHVASLEAQGAGHEPLERAHLLLGILSLEKFRDATADELAMPEDAWLTLRREIVRLDEALGRAQAQAEALRRRVRDELGLGDAPAGRRSMRRSDACRLSLDRAALLAAPAVPSALHLLAVIAGEPDGAIDLAFRREAVDARVLSEAALARALVEAVAGPLCREHGVELQISPEAETFLAAHPRRGELVLSPPLLGLVQAGKLSRHPLWRVVYDEGGLYVLPA